MQNNAENACINWIWQLVCNMVFLFSASTFSPITGLSTIIYKRSIHWEAKENFLWKYFRKRERKKRRK